MSTLAFYFSFVFVFTFLSTVESLTCSSENVLIYMNTSCLYATKVSLPVDQKWFKTDQCSTYNENSFLWYEPKIESWDKMYWLRRNLRNKFGYERSKTFRLGLRRDDASSEEAQNSTQWQDPSKWRWTMDNTTLSQKPENTLMWYPNEPNNIGFDPVDPQQCVVSDFNGWDDIRCDFGGDYLARYHYDFFVICESILVGGLPISTSTTSSDAVSGKSETAAYGSSGGNCHWKKFGIGLVVGVLIAGVMIAGVWFLRKRYFEKPGNQGWKFNQNVSVMNLVSSAD